MLIKRETNYKHIWSTTTIKTILILRDDRAQGNRGDGDKRGLPPDF